MIKDHQTLAIYEVLFRLAARDLLYAPSSREENIYYILLYISRGALAGNVLFNDGLSTFYLRLYGVGEKKEGIDIYIMDQVY